MANKFKSKIKKLAKSLAMLYEKEVIRQNLIDTGLMRDSFRVTIDVDKRGSIEIFVSSVYYFQYIDGSPHFFNVSGEVFKSKKYLAIEDQLLSIVSLEFALEFPKNFSTSDAVTYDFKFGKFFKGGQFIPGGRRAPKGGTRA